MQIWEELFNDEVVWDLESREFLNQQVMKFLKKHHHFPKNIWKLFNHNFNWEEQEEYLYAAYPESFIHYLFRQLRQTRGLRYSYFKKSQNNYEKY